MNVPSLRSILGGMHEDVERQLASARERISHPGGLGDASEGVWLELLQHYLPQRYVASRAHVLDSEGQISDQIDVVIYDRQYTPLIFTLKESTYVPAEGVYAVFECKQDLSAKHVQYAQRKVASVRRLKRTSLPIPHAGGTYPPKPLIPILGGILTLGSEWSPPMGRSLLDVLERADTEERLDLGCVAQCGIFTGGECSGPHSIMTSDKAATVFLFELIAVLQRVATVPMIDVRAYSRWLAVCEEDGPVRAH